MNKFIIDMINRGLVLVVLSFFSTLTFAGFLDSPWWDHFIYSTSDPVFIPGGVQQSASGNLFFSKVTGELISREQGKFSENGFDRMTATFSGNGKQLGFESLSHDAAQQWVEDHASELMHIVFGSMGRSLAGQDSSHAEASSVMSQLILTPSKGSRQKQKGLSIAGLPNRAKGALSYTDYKNHQFKGKRYGITLEYLRDLSDTTQIDFMLPYYNIDSNDTANTVSYILMPSLALSYKVIDDDSSEVKVGGNIQATGVFSDTDLGNLGYARYAFTLFGSYRYFMRDDITLTGGLSLGFGDFFNIDMGSDYQYITDAFKSYSADTTLGAGGLIEYELNDTIGLDFYLYGAHNFNPDNQAKNQITFGPQLRYTIYDTFDLNLAYHHTQDISGSNDFKADTIMLNALYDF